MENAEKNINDEIIDQLIIKVGELEKREVNIPEYTAHFDTLQQTFEGFLQQYNKDSRALSVAIKQLRDIDPGPQVQNAIGNVKSLLEIIQKALPVKHRHHFDFNTKGWIMAGMLLLIAVAISTGLSGYLWKENNRLQAADIKYRLLRQVASAETKWADSVYTSDPDETKKMLVKLESDQLRLNQKNRIQKKPFARKPWKRQGGLLHNK
jgi:hypothetical protein